MYYILIHFNPFLSCVFSKKKLRNSFKNEKSVTCVSASSSIEMLCLSKIYFGKIILSAYDLNVLSYWIICKSDDEYFVVNFLTCCVVGSRDIDSYLLMLIPSG